MTDRSFETQCPVCLEELFDENGVATEDVAEIICRHLVHSDCLAEAGKSLNADGNRYGVGGFGNRAGCPVCSEPVSYWVSSKDAAFFQGFWIGRIEEAAREIGPGHQGQDNQEMPVAAELIRKKLENDPSLTEAQKKHIRYDEDTEDSSGFYKALKNAGSVDYSVDRVMFASFLTTRGIWHYDKQRDTLWLWEWGLPHPCLSKCNHCGAKSSNLKACSGCRSSCDAAYYCNAACQKADWPRHKKKMCKTFQVMKQGGTREQLLQRLRAAGV